MKKLTKISCFLILQLSLLALLPDNGIAQNFIGQDNKLDSLFLVISASPEDTAKVKALNSLSDSYMYKGSYEKAMDCALEAKLLSEKLDFKKGLGESYGFIANISLMQGDYNKAINNFLGSLSIKEELGDKKGIAYTLNNIGVLYFHLENYEKALENYQKCLKSMQEIDDKKGVAASFTNIGLIYEKQGKYDEALEYHMKCLKGMEALGNLQAVASTFSNIGLIYEKQEKYDEALAYQIKAMNISEEIGEKHLHSIALGKIGNIYMKEGKLTEAHDYMIRSLEINKEIGNKEGIKEVYFSLSELYEQKNDFKEALKYHIKYIDIKDTLLNTENSKLIAEMNTRYDTEKKDKELIKKDAEIVKQQAVLEREGVLRYAFITGFSLVLLLVFFIYRGYLQKKVANKLLDKKNKKIIDSIDYAKRIQQALLPSIEEFKKQWPHSFVLFQPKDIVSGDFYWMHSIDADQTMIAAVDCTGHGVPGSLMSMLSYNLLDQVVKEKQIYEPASVLNELSKLVVKTLKQTGELGEGSDGMDMALCKINNKTNEMEFAGAHNSLYLVRDGELEEIKADWKSIGISMGKEKSFTNHKIQFKKGDVFYLFSDGFVDQKGGSDNNKFYYKPFRKLLVDINNLKMEDQQQKLESVINEWRGDKEQIDDVLVIGLKM